jgi:hypothetical protein
LASVGGIPGDLDFTVAFLKHTSSMVELFSDKHAIYDVNDARLKDLETALRFFSDWKQQVTKGNQFFSEKLWFDLQSMIHGFTSIVQTKLSRFPGSTIKPAIANQDVVENHFSQLRSANGQNDNPTYQAVQGTQNSIIFGQTSISKKSNTGVAKNTSFADLPKQHLFSSRAKDEQKKEHLQTISFLT